MVEMIRGRLLSVDPNTGYVLGSESDLGRRHGNIAMNIWLRRDPLKRGHIVRREGTFCPKMLAYLTPATFCFQRPSQILKLTKRASCLPTPMRTGQGGSCREGLVEWPFGAKKGHS